MNKTVKIGDINSQLFAYLFGNQEIELTPCEQILTGVSEGDYGNAILEWQKQEKSVLKHVKK